MSPIVVVRLLLLGVAATAILSCVLGRPAPNRARPKWPVLLAAVVGTILFRIPFGGQLFQGLEYEDAYVYSVVGRELVESSPHQSASGGYLTSVCAIGSIQRCIAAEQYSGHYIGLPVLIAATAEVFGFTPMLGPLISLAASCLSAVLSSLIAGVIFRSSSAAVLSALVFASTPVFAVNGMAAYAEPFSNACIALVLLSYLRCVYDVDGVGTHRWGQVNAILCVGLSLLLAVAVKRENLIMAAGLPAIAGGLWLLNRRRTIRWRAVPWLLLCSASTFWFGLTEMNIAAALPSEAAEFGVAPFGIRQARVLFPLFVSAFASVPWYGATTLCAIIGALKGIRDRNLSLYPVVIIVAYVGSYSLHVRSYYQLHAGDTLPYETLRYAMNLMVMWSVLAGGGVALLWSTLRAIPFLSRSVRLTRSVGIAVGCVYLGYCAFATSRLRTELVQSEARARIAPATAASRVAQQFGHETFIITPEPLIIELFGDTATRFIGLPHVSSEVLAFLRREHPQAALLYLDLDTYATRANERRFAKELAILERFQRRLILGVRDLG